MTALLQISNLKVRGSRARWANGHSGASLYGVSLELERGETLGIVGETGAGKRLLAAAILRRARPDSGEIHFAEKPIGAMRGAALRDYRRNVQILGPDPLAALNPRFSVAQILAEPLRVHRLCPPREVASIVETMLRRVGLDPVLERRQPADLTREQALRIGVARALCLEPQILILDEPEAAVGVSTLAQVFHLIAELQDAMQFALILLSGNPGVARYLCRHLAVMYVGRIVELGPTEEIVASPRHPYTRALLEAMPRISRPIMPPMAGLAGDPPAGTLPPGCAFHTCCPQAKTVCGSGDAPIRRNDGPVAVGCHLYPEAPSPRR